MYKLTVILLLSTSVALAGTWDFAANFNAPNNPSASSAFSYGEGANPAGFTLFGVSSADCVGSPTYCYGNGNGFPSHSGVAWNGTGGTIGYATIVQPPTVVQMDPQSSAGTIIRFTAPTTDLYDVAGFFSGIDVGQHPTSVNVYHNAANLLSGTVSGFGTSVPAILSSLSLTAGDTLDFIVISASDCCFLSTGLEGTITSQTAETPEPGTIALVALALPLIARFRRRRLN